MVGITASSTAPGLALSSRKRARPSDLHSPQKPPRPPTRKSSKRAAGSSSSEGSPGAESDSSSGSGSARSDGTARRHSPVAVAAAPTSAATKGKEAYRKGFFLAFIDDALSQLAQGNPASYHALIAQFRSFVPSSSLPPLPSSSSLVSATSTATTSSQLRSYLLALTAAASALSVREHALLVDTVLALPWATMDTPFAQAWEAFVRALVSARMEWLKAVVERLVKGLRYHSSYTLRSPLLSSSLTRRTIYSRIHTLLLSLLALIPTLPAVLVPLLCACWPAKREGRKAHVVYTQNVLLLARDIQGAQEGVWRELMGRVASMDGELQGDADDWEDDDESDSESEGGETETEGTPAPATKAKSRDRVAELLDRPAAAESDEEDRDDDDDDSGDEGPTVTGDSSTFDMDALSEHDADDDEPVPVSDEQAQRFALAQKKNGESMTPEARKKAREMAGKLDAVLRVVLDHLAATEGLVGAAEQNERRWRTLLEVFERTILRTFKTQHVQFVLFFLCSHTAANSKSTYTEAFLGLVLSRVLTEHKLSAKEDTALTRVAAAGYVASFVARAKFVDRAMCRRVVARLCTFIDRESAQKGGQQQAYYAACQAAFYIFCFRWKDLLEDVQQGEDGFVGVALDEDDEELSASWGKAGGRWMPELEGLKRQVAGALNPLKYCGTSVAEQFCDVAYRVNFMYAHPVLLANKRSGGSGSSTPLAAPSPARGRASTVSSVALLGGRPPLPSSGGSAPDLRALQGGAAVPPAAKEMDSFFPFDPFKLPESASYFDSEVYREWQSDSLSSAGGDSDSDSSSSDSSSEDDNDTDDDMGIAMTLQPRRNSQEDAVVGSFEAMSLSPDETGAWARHRQNLLVV